MPFANCRFFVFATTAFALIYHFLPRVKIRWHDVWIGASLTALLFTLGKLLIGLYIGKSGVACWFNGASSVVILFVGVCYSAQILLMGAAVCTGRARANPGRPQR